MSTHTVRLLAAGGEPYEFDQDVVSIGRAPNQDFVLNVQNVSRRHAELRRVEGEWTLIDCDSANGTWALEERIQRLAIPPGTTLDVSFGGATGSPVAIAAGGSVAVGEHSASTVAGLESPTLLSLHSPGSTITVGREPGNDLVLADPLISRFHASLSVSADGDVVLRDHRSFNGTHVNGRLVEGEERLWPGDNLVLGTRELVWTGTELQPKEHRNQRTLFAESLRTVAPSGRVLLDDVSFSLPTGSLIAVVGPSGAGKSTLLGALTGLRPATQGRVTWGGRDLYRHYEELRFQIGLVPQDDIQHPQLMVRQGLDYSARLRLPPDTSPAERHTRVTEVVNQLQLEKQIDLRIGSQLSGGQRKRVSIATELLTAPPVLFLDEPTSGLDPGLDRDVMLQLRALADEGRAVMVVTHSVLALETCDRLLVLAPGGRLVYSGAPADVLDHFGCPDYPALYGTLEEADRWVNDTPSDLGDVWESNDASSPAPPPKQGWWRQLSTLVRRTVTVTLADRLLLGMLVLMPVALGGLSRVVEGSAGYSLTETIGADGQSLDHREVVQRLTILVLSAALMGTAITIRELIKERAIFLREYAVGLSPDTYLASKIIVFGMAGLFQGILVTRLSTWGLPGPDGAGALGWGWIEIALAIGLLTSVMAAFGLAISAMVTSSEQTMPVLVGAVMLQLVFSGALVNVAGRFGLEQLSWFAPARWAYASTAVTVDLQRSRDQAGEPVDLLMRPSAAQWWTDMGCLAALGALGVLVGLVITRSRLDRRM